MEKILPMSLKLSFTPNPLECYGFNKKEIPVLALSHPFWCENKTGVIRIFIIFEVDLSSAISGESILMCLNVSR